MTDADFVRQSMCNLAKDVRTACDDLIGHTTSPSQFAGMLRALAQRAHKIVEVVDVPTLPQISSAGAALLSWARDMRVQEFVQTRRVHIDRKTQWRWIDSDEQTGMIHALPTIRGIPRITNGILVAIERDDGRVFMGHLDWFEKDHKSSGERRSKKPSAAQSRNEEFIAQLKEALLA